MEYILMTAGPIISYADGRVSLKKGLERSKVKDVCRGSTKEKGLKALFNGKGKKGIEVY